MRITGETRKEFKQLRERLIDSKCKEFDVIAVPDRVFRVPGMVGIKVTKNACKLVDTINLVDIIVNTI